MAFIAYCEKEHINKRRAKDIKPKEQRDIFYCQNTECNCKFTVAALNSDKIRTHFVKLPSSEHIAGCWNDVRLPESGDKDDYNTSDFSPVSLLESVQQEKNKKAPVKKPEIDNFGFHPGTIPKETLYIHTIRQLYSVCLMNDDSDEINGIEIKGIFAGRKTSYLYTRYISGIKLVECSYYSYDAESNIIKFRFPYGKNNFMIQARFKSTELFKKIRKELYNYKRPILIYAMWNNNVADIKSQQQMVPLK